MSTRTITHASTVTVTATSSGSTASAATSAPASATTSTTPAGPPSCSTVAASISPTASIPPTLCTDSNGDYLRLATDDHAIRLTGATVRFRSAHTEASLSGPISSVTANGTFLILSLTVTNTGNNPASVETPGLTQFALSPITGKSREYTENFNAENGPDQSSFIANDNPVQPGESQTGDIIFDVPASALSQMRRHGATLLFARPGEDLSTSTPTSPRRPWGLMVIYHRDLQH